MGNGEVETEVLPDQGSDVNFIYNDLLTKMISHELSITVKDLKLPEEYRGTNG